ncbi:ankyrin repeat domain-containing protein 54-like [Dendronephthya gigantea]|uniref:ankyrin repeat domain-containing protein 54-like n=1 Tax=Dendronephthya gigantea TaxID=151771 RepID=UPI001068F070|nr:ankyrin repeat domain-containing protein 54-like [Dendronephthya gigantea]
MTESNAEEDRSKIHLNWSPEAPAGLNFTNVLPDNFGSGYQALPSENEQRELKTKLKSSRLTTRRHSKVLRTCAGLNFLGEKRFREAANSGNFEMVERLIGEGVKVSCADTKKRTALHFAASKGDVAIVQVLLSHGANPNLQDINGNTPLHLAACASHIKIVTILAEHGANVNALDECGRSPLQLAFARLRLIEEDEIAHSTAKAFKAVVMEVVKLLQIYLSKVGHVMNEQENLDDIFDRLEKTTSIKQVDEIHELLSSFTSLSLSRRGLNT